MISPGICPVCKTDLDHDEIVIGNGWFEAFCCVCSRYFRKRMAAGPKSGRRVIAALYVETGGVYAGLPDVEVWDEARDARNYDGPWPVVAHPPCARWSSLAYVNQKLHGYRVGDDGGCFYAALRAVREYGGVLEHPAWSLAWKAFGLPVPYRGHWRKSLIDPGWTTEVSQVTYGHRARKPTWLYYVGSQPPADLDWRDAEGECIVGDLWHGNGRRLGRGDRPRMYQREALATPAAFRDALLGLARGCGGAGPVQADELPDPDMCASDMPLPVPAPVGPQSDPAKGREDQ